MELSDIKNVSDKTVSYLSKLSINNITDLINYYPYRFNVLVKSNMNDNSIVKVTIDGLVISKPIVSYFRYNMNKMTFNMEIENSIYKIVIYNRAYLRNEIDISKVITVIGKLEGNTITASDIRLEGIESNIIEGVYHSTNKLTSKAINSIINNALDLNINIKDFIPDYLRTKYNLLDKYASLRIIHKPTEDNELKKAVLRLKYEELFMFMLKISYIKFKNEVNYQCKLDRYYDINKVNDFIDNLPFKLTEDQHSAVNDIITDFNESKRMNRIIIGDVGSGKTIVSFIALYMNYLCGYQGALMVPTEILSIQHYNNIKKILPNLNIELITGSITKSNKKKIYNKLINNEIDIIIGTHALIQDDVAFYNLGLVITDEQHRFGVNQREVFKNKGLIPDVLYMSATPIPRTYALTIYKDMDISSIKTMPKGRKPITTILKNNKDIKDVLTLIYEELKKNHQIYIIAPLVSESEKSNLEDVYSLKDKFTKAFRDKYKIDIIHGKLSNSEKDNIMNLYKNNEINILISTTVIEVGVDVSNASVIVIFDAGQFGLSQLHQLRGRVGRGNIDSYCILISDKEHNRLKLMTEISDGFLISEADFKMRGSGDLFGIKQSGDMDFKISDLKKDFKILLKAKEDAEEYIKNGNTDNNEYIHINEELKELSNLS